MSLTLRPDMPLWLDNDQSETKRVILLAQETGGQT